MKPKSKELSKEEFSLASEVSDYLDNLALGLEEDFPEESFDHIKLLGRLGVISRLYERMVKNYLNQFSLMPVEAQVLVTLRSNVASSPAELANATQQTRAGMTSTLDRLEKRKLIKRAPHDTDRRKCVIKLTKSGENLTNKVVSIQNRALETILKNTSKADLTRFNTTLNQLIDLM